MSHPNSKLSTVDRFLLYVHKTGDCWNWTGGKNQKGYGLFWNPPLRQGAHRVAYQLFNGPIPDGLEIDHLCRNRGCVNPAHLEAVDHRTNVLRSPDHVGKREARKTHCPRGHEYDATRKGKRPGSTRRACTKCERARRPSKAMS